MSSNCGRNFNLSAVPCPVPSPISCPIIQGPPIPEIQSAFRAVRNETNTTINIPANTNMQVLYPNEQYDLINEYNTFISTFIPTTKGIYSIIASVELLFNAVPVLGYDLLISIMVNNTAVASDSEDFTRNSNNIVSVSTNIELNAGDQVQVFVTSSTSGRIASNPATTHFEATRLPSPTM